MATSMFRPNFPGAEALQQAADTATFIIGLDVHKKTVAICVVDPRRPDEPVFQRKRLPNADLLRTLQHFSGRKVVVCEAAYGWFAVREALAPLSDITLVLLDTRKTGSWIATSGIKNDKIDAQVLCPACTVAFGLSASTSPAARPRNAPSSSSAGSSGSGSARRSPTNSRRSNATTV